MKRPSFQFYPSDWQTNSNLRRCTRVEKSIWLDVMCLMHDSEEYGVLRWTLKELAAAANCKVSELRGLIEKGVLKGADAGERCQPFIYVPRSGRKDGPPATLLAEQPGPLWYSSRMVKDEYIRTNAGAATRFGEPERDTPPRTNPRGNAAPGSSPARRHGADQSDGSSSSTSSSVKEVSSEANASAEAVASAQQVTPPEIPENPQKSADPPAQPPDIRTEFWHDGLAVFRRITGKTEGASRTFLGRWLRDLRDDCALGLTLLRQAESDRPGDPIAWLAAAVQARNRPRGEHPLSHASQLRRAADALGLDLPETSR